MTDRPAYLSAKDTKTGLEGLDDIDTGKVKPWAVLDGDSLEDMVSRLATKPSERFGRPVEGVGTPDWLLRCEPREAQLEALRRSYMGVALKDERDDAGDPRIIREGGEPARGFGHFMEQRVGKTPTALNEFLLFRRDHGIKRAIVLSPNAFKRDWPLEAERFGVDAHTFAFDSKDRMEATRFVSKHRDNMLMSVNYEALGYEATLSIIADLCDRETMIIGDESIAMKTHNSGVTRAALDLSKKCGVRRALSGKPITQGPHDIWSQLRFVGHLNGYMFHPFKTHFCRMGGFQGKSITGIKNPEELQALIRDASFLARKVDWLKTPGKDYAERRLTLLPDQARMYASMMEDFLVELENGTIVTADQIVTKLLKLQQISSGFIIDEFKQVHDLMPLEKNPKLVELRRQMVEEFEGKVIVLAHHTHAVDQLLEALKPWNPAVIRGEQWHHKEGVDILAEKARFNLDPNCRVIVGQSLAIRYGHTLMGDIRGGHPCYTEVFYENSYNLNTRDQCENRPQGEGQEQPITIWDYVASEADMAPIRALQRKEDIAAVLMQYDRGTGVLPPRPESAQR